MYVCIFSYVICVIYVTYKKEITLGEWWTEVLKRLRLTFHILYVESENNKQISRFFLLTNWAYNQKRVKWNSQCLLWREGISTQTGRAHVGECGAFSVRDRRRVRQNSGCFQRVHVSGSDSEKMRQRRCQTGNLWGIMVNLTTFRGLSRNKVPKLWKRIP